ncbi:MAG TPA: hypothetical protein VG225_13665 [Terracidiphilus sp.]|jgi:hypothetical protein|nr:hypothetical protein [Terracidiphilus sp.]
MILVMSLLQQGPSDIDDAARGEEITKGSGHLVIATVIATIVVMVVIAIYVITGQKPPASAGEVTRVVAHTMHRESSGLDASGAPVPKEAFDQVLVFTHVKLHNQSKDPLFLRQVLTNVTLDDGVHTSYAATPNDYERLFQAYPDLASLHGRSLTTDATIPAGQWLEGDFVSSFRMPKAQWDARKGLDYNISFRYLPDLKLAPSGPVTDQ